MAATYGISASLFGEVPLAKVVTKLSARAWKQAELGFLSKPEADWRADVPGARTLLEGAGIAVPSVHISSAGWNLADPDDAVRRAALAQALGCLAPAAALGARVVVCHHNAPRTPFLEEDRAASTARARQALRELADRASALGACRTSHPAAEAARGCEVRHPPVLIV